MPLLVFNEWQKKAEIDEGGQCCVYNMLLQKLVDDDDEWIFSDPEGKSMRYNY